MTEGKKHRDGHKDVEKRTNIERHRQGGREWKKQTRERGGRSEVPFTVIERDRVRTGGGGRRDRKIRSAFHCH